MATGDIHSHSTRGKMKEAASLHLFHTWLHCPTQVGSTVPHLFAPVPHLAPPVPHLMLQTHSLLL